MKPTLKVIRDDEFETELIDAASDIRLDGLEDIHLKEVAECNQAKADARRNCKSACSTFDAQIAALQQSKASTIASTKSETAKLDRRIKAATAYLAAMQEPA